MANNQPFWKEKNFDVIKVITSIDSTNHDDHFMINRMGVIRPTTKIRAISNKKADATHRYSKLVSFVSFDTDDIFHKKRL